MDHDSLSVSGPNSTHQIDQSVLHDGWRPQNASNASNETWPNWLTSDQATPWLHQAPQPYPNDPLASYFIYQKQNTLIVMTNQMTGSLVQRFPSFCSLSQWNLNVGRPELQVYDRDLLNLICSYRMLTVLWVLGHFLERNPFLINYYILIIIYIIFYKFH